MDAPTPGFLRGNALMEVKMRKSEHGQGLVEYALILVLVAVVVIVILSLVGGIFVNPNTPFCRYEWNGEKMVQVCITPVPPTPTVTSAQ